MYESLLTVDPDADVWDALAAQWAAEDDARAGDFASADGLVAEVLSVGPGPWAAAVLWQLDRARLSQTGRLGLLAAWQAQTAWAEANAADALVGHLGVEVVAPPPTRWDGREQDLAAQSRLAEASLVLRTAESTLRNRHEVAGALAARLPATRAALHAGHVSYVHVLAVVRATAGLADTEAAAVDAAAMRDPHTLTPATLRRRLARAVAAIAPDTAATRARAAHQTRTITRFGEPDGLACLAVWAQPRDIQAMWTALTTLAGPPDTDDPRPIGARRVDALLGLCLAATTPTGDPTCDATVGQQAAHRAEPGVEVQIVVDLATLAGLADHPGELVGHGPVPAGIIRDWLTDATTWRRLVTDPVTGHLLDYGPKTRFAPHRLRAFITARDHTCTFPSCQAPAARCDLDHEPAWQPAGTGGHTSTDHLAALCRRHHNLKTHAGWRLHRLPDGASRWTSPTGHSYDVLRRPKLPDP